MFISFCILFENRQHQSVVRLTLPPFSDGDVSLPHRYRHYQIIANPLESSLSTSTKRTEKSARDTLDPHAAKLLLYSCSHFVGKIHLLPRGVNFVPSKRSAYTMFWEYNEHKQIIDTAYPLCPLNIDIRFLRVRMGEFSGKVRL